MNGFNRSYMYRSTETEKKGRKTKNHREDACKCLPPFVKLHCYNCPAVMKPCPIHGSFFHHTEKQQAVQREQNVIISFHPSSKTERLLQPIKNLLAHCNSETKINFQYYSPENATSKESLKAENNQNAYEHLKRSLNSNVFVEKTKSFVASKASKVRKLKQCFHSPCNSIAQKTRSQTSIKEKINQILREEAKQSRNVFYNMVPEIPPDDKKYDSTSKWFYSNNAFKRHDMLSEETLDSDFITVTQQGKDNAIHHKIFEIKHRKGLNDTPFVGFSKPPTHLVYSTVNVNGGAANENMEYTQHPNKKQVNYEPDDDYKNEKIDLSSSVKTNRSMSSSSGSSVYITPFIFVPRGMEDSDPDIRPKLRQVDMVEEGVQVEDESTQRKEVTAQETQTSQEGNESLDTLSPQQSSPIASPKASPEPSPEPSPKASPEPSPVVSPTPSPAGETKFKSVLLQTDSSHFEATFSRSSRRVYIHDYERQSAPRMEEIYSTNERAIMTSTYDDDSIRQNKRSEISRRTLDSGRHYRTTEIQTGCSTPLREVLITARWETRTKDNTSQTDDLWNLQVSVKTFDSRTTKSQGSVPNTTATHLSDKGIQIPSNENTPEDLEFIHLNSRDMTYVIKPFEQEESDQDIEKLAKTWWGKSHSDGDLHERLKCVCCKAEADNQYLQCNFSKNSGVVNSSGEKSTVTRAGGSGAEGFPKGANIVLRTKETVERFSDMKQTSTKEEEISAAVSDLSELKKIIQEFFEKGNVNSRKTCECDMSVMKGTRVEKETITDAPTSVYGQKKERSFIDRTVQTILEYFPTPDFRLMVTRENQTSEREKKTELVQTSFELKRGNAEVQTSVETVKKVAKNEVGVQTSAKVLKEELRRKDVVDHETQTKFPLICEVCRREMQNSTKPETSYPVPERQPKSTIVGTEYTEIYEIKTRARKPPNGDPSKRSKPPAQATAERKDGRETRRTSKPQEDSSPRNSQKKSPPNPSTSVRFRQNETADQRNEYLSQKWTRQVNAVSRDFTSFEVVQPPRECICHTLTGSSTKGGQRQDNESAKARPPKPQQGPDRPRRETTDVQTNRRKTPSTDSSGGKVNRNKYDYAWPVMVTPFWPNEFMNTWKSMESAISDMPSSDDSKSQGLKQKRHSEMDAAAAGKKIKVDIKQLSDEYQPEVPDMLSQDELGQVKISNFSSNQQKIPHYDRNSTEADEPTVNKLARPISENRLENDEDFLLEEERFSDGDYTPGTTDNSLVGDEETAEEDEGATAVEEQTTSPTRPPKLKSQCHSAVTFNKSFFSEDMTTSRSMNSFWFLINPNQMKRPRRKKKSK